MKLHNLSFGIGAGMMLVGAVANAQYFNYSAVLTPSPLASSQAGSFVTVTDKTSTGVPVLPTGSDIVPVTFHTVTNAPQSNPATFSDLWTLKLTLAPSTVGGVALAGPITDTYTGTMSGILTSQGVSIIDVVNPQVSQPFNFGTLGTYTVTFDSSLFVAPGAPSMPLPGALGALVTYKAFVKTNDTPEPGAIATLFGMSVPGILLGARRRKLQSSN